MVIIASRGPKISGDALQVVVVKTDDGYGPDPGQSATGTVVAVPMSMSFAA